MSTLPHTSTNPVNETPSMSTTKPSDNAGAGPEGATLGSQVGMKDSPSESVKASDAGSQATKMGETAPGAFGGGQGSAEKAAEKLYEERIEDEYAKREGGA